MRSFLECVSCWSTMTHEQSMTEEVVTAAVAPQREEETKSLMHVDTESASRRKTTRVRMRVGSTGPMWKPSLCSITEDNIVAEKTPSRTPMKTTRTVDRVVKRKSPSWSHSNVHVRSHSNDTGRSLVPVILPTFSPTPFMF